MIREFLHTLQSMHVSVAAHGQALLNTVKHAEAAQS